MARCRFTGKSLAFRLAAMFFLSSAGCFGHHKEALVVPPPPTDVPAELKMVSFPPYVIEAPDILLIDVVYDAGEVDKKPKALEPQPISGTHLVRMDGTVLLGIWGEVPVTGLSLAQASDAIGQHVFRKIKTEARLGKVRIDSVDKLFVIVDVLAYNSKKFFVITDGAGFGEQIYEMPMMGNETVLSALAKINGLPDIASKRDIWLARRSPLPGAPEQILPVDYVGITQKAVTATNYQVFPGDRIYVKAQGFFVFDRFLQKALTPVERILGVTLLGSSTVNSIKNKNSNSPTGQ